MAHMEMETRHIRDSVYARRVERKVRQVHGEDMSGGRRVKFWRSCICLASVSFLCLRASGIWMYL